MSIKILIADDHGVVRQGLRSLLEQQPDMEVVGEAEDGRKALELVRKIQPDIVIMDVSMPNLNGVGATSQILHEFPNIKVIALSMHSNTIYVGDMIKAGASGYVLKECLFGELVEAVRVVSKGGTYLSPLVVGIVVSDYVKRLTDVGSRPLETLTDREREVLQLIGEGKSTKEIALALHVSTKAVEANRRRIMEKLHSRTVADLVRWAMLGGLTTLDIASSAI
jgi:DNA-binding NarL/FixJ family response regulator